VGLSLQLRLGKIVIDVLLFEEHAQPGLLVAKVIWVWKVHRAHDMDGENKGSRNSAT
jgi:hypothetical protein